MLTDDQARQIADSLKTSMLAQLQIDKTDNPRETVLIRLDLSTARLETAAFRPGFNFRQCVIHDASDAQAVVNFKTSRDETNDAIGMKLNSRFASDRLLVDGNFYWEAQANKWVDVLFIVRGNYESGRNISQNGGGVSINDGASFTNTQVAIAAGTNGETILSSNTDRKVAYIQNKTGGVLYYGDSSATASDKYTSVAAGGIIEWRNTSALYGYSASGGNVSVEEHS